MKKLLAVFLVVLLVSGVFAGCSSSQQAGQAGTDQSGKEIAKLLLANQRLDSGVFSDADKNGALNFIPTRAQTAKPSGFVGLAGKGMSTLTPTASYRGSDFTVYCNMLSFFESYMAEVRLSAENAAKLIDDIKGYVSYTDVWVPSDSFASPGRVMLSVDANAELLLRDQDGVVSVCRRYTDQNGDSVYEIYTKDPDGIADLYLLYIPDKRYEFSMLPHNGEQWLNIVAENSRGYWNMFTVYDAGEGQANVQNLISTNKTTYVNYARMDTNGYQYSDHTMFSDAGCNCDVLTVMNGDLGISPSAFQGIASVQTDSGNLVTSFTTTSGKKVVPQDVFADGAVTFAHGGVSTGVGTDGQLYFSFAEDLSYQQKAALLKQALAELGITCKYDLDSIVANIPAAIELGQEFGSYYKWNGYAVNTMSNVKKGMAAVTDRSSELFDEYQERKDNKELEITPKGFNFKGYNFAVVSALSANSVTFDNGKIAVDGLSVTVKDLAVFDKGEQYTVHLALAKLNDTAAAKNTALAGKLQHGGMTLLSAVPTAGSVDADYTAAILMAGENGKTAVYSPSDSFTLSQTATFTLPDCDEQGVYTVAAYVATADGIRVSQMIPLSFTSEVAYSATTPNGLSYTLKLNEFDEVIAIYGGDALRLTLPAKEGGYSYDEVYNALKSFVLNHGYPAEGAVLEVYDPQTKSGKAADKTATFAKTTCRMKYSDQANNREAYAYAVISE